MVQHIAPDFVLSASRVLGELNLGLFSDFLVVKRDILRHNGKAEITNTSTLNSIRTLLGVHDASEHPMFIDRPFFNPLDSKGAGNWRVADYPRTGPQSNIKRKKLGSIFDLNETSGTTVASLKSGHVELMEANLLGRKKRSPRIPLGDLAAWAMRYETFDEEDDGSVVVSKFIDEYGISNEEREAFFEDGRMPVLEVGPVSNQALNELLAANYGQKEEVRRKAPAPEVGEVSEDLLSAIAGGIVVEDAILNQIVTLVRLGRNIILTGPPGTGKSTLAINLAKAASSGLYGLPSTNGWILTTATADWSTFDTIGGYAPSSSGGLAFQPGMFLKAIESDEWLLIDELNRADIDKAFGQLFSVLSGQSVDLPYTDKDGEQVRIVTARDPSDGDGDYAITTDWRVIATMNTVDRSQLFQVSAALMRRFAVVHVPVPSIDKLEDWLKGSDYAPEVVERTLRIAKETLNHRALGPAIVQEISDYLQVGFNKTGSVEDETVFAALSSFVFPQLDGLSVTALNAVRSGLSWSEELDRSLTVRFAELFGD